MTEFTIEDVVTKYITIRNIKREMEKDLEEALKPINEKLEKLEAYLLAKMNDDKVDSYKTQAGTAYKSVKTSCSIADKGMYQQFVFSPAIKQLECNYGIPKESAITILTNSPLWNLVDFRALKKGVEEYIEDNKTTPPGLNITQTTVVNIRSK